MTTSGTKTSLSAHWTGGAAGHSYEEHPEMSRGTMSFVVTEAFAVQGNTYDRCQHTSLSHFKAGFRVTHLGPRVPHDSRNLPQDLKSGTEFRKMDRFSSTLGHFQPWSYIIIFYCSSKYRRTVPCLSELIGFSKDILWIPSRFLRPQSGLHPAHVSIAASQLYSATSSWLSHILHAMAQL